MKATFIKVTKAGLAVTCLLLIVAGCKKNPFPKPNQLNANYEQVNLVGDDNQYNPVRIVPDLRNAWGIAFAPSGPAWVNAQVTGLSFIFNTQGGDVRPPVAIPSPTSDIDGGHPTGIVFNGSSGFRLPNGNPARFIFVGDDGVISGWNGGNVAVRVKDHSSNASYTGLAIAADGADSFIYAANFLSGHIEVYDTAWGDVSGKPFTDPSLPPGYAPFNIQNVDGNLFVTYAKVSDEPGEEETGAGLGVVDIYHPNGNLIKRFVSPGDQLNAPWGVTVAPKAFWANQGDDEDDNGKTMGNKHHTRAVILIGNLGDGHINAYNQDGDFIGALRSNGKVIEIEGLWALSFAPATATTIDPNWLFFAAGPGDEEHGLFGYIKRD
ncbi:MAG TPA: TIGR03118 family protein [Chitinophagaceae bacterium]|jgi:uncharacterized protein (TIGR03118 family)|nr:TIGR03118 family protein [Chitinophagaceae bacterium]